MEKEIQLKNKLYARLSIMQMQDCFFIQASDRTNNQVGYCKFTINKHFARILTDAQRQLYAKNHNIDISNAPKHVEITSIGFLDLDNKYKLIKCSCSLNQIEILDKNYIKTGLGSAMLNEMEKIAIQNNCTSITGLYHPFGEFQDATDGFYAKHGYTISSASLAHITKVLQDDENENI